MYSLTAWQLSLCQTFFFRCTLFIFPPVDICIALRGWLFLLWTEKGWIGLNPWEVDCPMLELEVDCLVLLRNRWRLGGDSFRWPFAFLRLWWGGW